MEILPIHSFVEVAESFLSWAHSSQQADFCPIWVISKGAIKLCPFSFRKARLVDQCYDFASTKFLSSMVSDRHWDAIGSSAPNKQKHLVGVFNAFPPCITPVLQLLKASFPEATVPLKTVRIYFTVLSIYRIQLLKLLHTHSAYFNSKIKK